MNYFRLMLLSSAVLFIIVNHTDAQTISSVVANPSTGRVVSTREVEPIYAETAVAGQPYSGVQISENVQTLADGTRITQKRRERHMYRDSQGRTRSESPLFSMGNSETSGQISLIEIRDPVEGVGYVLDEQNHVAHRYKLAQRPMPYGLDDPAGSHSVAEIHIESSTPVVRPPRPDAEQLGEQTISGVVTKGTRTTQTTEVGAIGNDRPISRVCESWTSPELKLTLISKCSDPRFGESNNHIENLDRSEPDSALFRPPADYTIVDETGPITFKVTRTVTPQP